MTFDTSLARARAVPIDVFASRRGFKLSRVGVELVGACPKCGGVDRFGVNSKKQVWHCRHCTEGGDTIALCMHVDGLNFRQAVERLGGEASDARPRQTSEDESARRTKPLSIWQEAADPHGTLVEKYLAGRGLELPADAAEVLRFHPNCTFGQERRPCMIALVRNIITNEPQAIHRTALNSDGSRLRDASGKTARLSLGPVAGGAIKLDPDEHVEQGLVIGEGAETVLSGMQKGRRPAWSLIGTGGISKFPVLPSIEGLHIFREHDANGASQRAVKECATRWHEAGREVIIVDPELGKDLNDELRVEAGL